VFGNTEGEKDQYETRGETRVQVPDKGQGVPRSTGDDRGRDLNDRSADGCRS